MKIAITIVEDEKVTRNEMKEIKTNEEYEYRTAKFEGTSNDLKDLVKELSCVFRKKGLKEVDFYDIKSDLERLIVGKEGEVEIPEISE